MKKFHVIISKTDASIVSISECVEGQVCSFNADMYEYLIDDADEVALVDALTDNGYTVADYESKLLMAKGEL